MLNRIENTNDNADAARRLVYSKLDLRRQLREGILSEGSFPYPIALLKAALEDFDREYQASIAKEDDPTYRWSFED